MSEERKDDINVKRSFKEIIKDLEFWKGISTVFGAILVSLITGSIFSLCTLAVYQISYIKGIDPDNFITIDHLSFYYPFEVIFQCLSSFLSGFIEKKLGLHLTNLIGFTILGSGYFTMYLSRNFFIDILAMILGGIGNGIIYYPSTTNACLWFYEHNGIVIGIIETMISLGSFLFAFIGEKIININNVESRKSDDLYDLEIGERIKIYLIVQIISLVGVFILSFFLMFIKKKEPNIRQDANSMKPLEMTPKTSDTDGVFLVSETEDIQSDLISKDSNKSEKSNFKKMILVALKSKRLILYAIISVFTIQGPSMMFTLYRGIGEYNKIDTETLQLVGSIGFIFECSAGILIGILSDYVNLKVLLLVMGLLNTSIIYTYCLTFDNSAAFFWITNIESLVNGGIYPFNDCYLMKVFGTDIYIELIGYVSFVSNLVVVLLSPLAYFVETKVENKNDAYWILFSIFGTLNLIAFVLSFFINTKPFDFDERIGLAKNKIQEDKLELQEEEKKLNNI